MDEAKRIHKSCLRHRSADRQGKLAPVSIHECRVGSPVEMRRTVPVTTDEQRNIGGELAGIANVLKNRIGLLHSIGPSVLGSKEFFVTDLGVVAKIVRDV